MGVLCVFCLEVMLLNKYGGYWESLVFSANFSKCCLHLFFVPKSVYVLANKAGARVRFYPFFVYVVYPYVCHLFYS